MIGRLIVRIAIGECSVGIRASYHIVKDGSRLGEMYDVDKAFNEFCVSLDALNLDGSFIVYGKSLVEEPDDASYDDYDANYFGGLSPAEVERNWQALKDVTFEQLLGGLQTSYLRDCYDDAMERSYLEHHFATFKDVYRTAAAQGAGIEIDAC
jgi:hypothetical protein